MKSPQSSRFGYHVVKSLLNPKSAYLGKDGRFVVRKKALLFMSYAKANEYMESRGIETGNARNVVVPCNCSDSDWDEHFFG